MVTLQSPPRNILSSRLPRVPTKRSFPDYLSHQCGTAIANKGTKLSLDFETTMELLRSGFGAQLAARLLDLLHLPRLRAGSAVERVVAQYVADTATLADQVDAVNKLFATIADTQTQMFNPVALLTGIEELGFRFQSQLARRRIAETLFTPQTPSGLLGSHLVTAEVLATQRSSLLSMCQEDLRRRCGLLATYVKRCLVAGVDTGLLGIVAWPAEDACWYARGEHRVKPEGAWRENRYNHWRVIKEVHLMDAVTLGGVPGWLELPPAVQSVAESIPPLLWPHLGTVVGTMIRQRELSWLVGTVTYPSELPAPQQREVVIDPALVLGNIVLTGWELPHHRTPGWWMRLDRWLSAPAEVERG